MIDIGGPALLRAAAKNFVDVVPVCEASRYEEILAELAERRRLARHPPQARRRGVRAHRRLRDVDRGLVRRRRDVSAAAAPLARARAASSPTARTRTSGRRTTPRPACAGTSSPGSTASAGRSSRSTTSTTSTPRAPCCGSSRCRPASSSSTRTRAASRSRRRSRRRTSKALASDPVSAYGGIVALNRKVSPQLAARLAEQFVEVLIAPDYDDDALATLRRRRPCGSCATASAAARAPATATTGACSAASSSRTPTPRWTTARA